MRRIFYFLLLLSKEIYFFVIMTPIEEYILELINTYAFYVLTWTYDNLVILYYYLSSLATIVLLEYLFLFFTGKKKTEIIWCLCKV